MKILDEDFEQLEHLHSDGGYVNESVTLQYCVEISTVPGQA